MNMVHNASEAALKQCGETLMLEIVAWGGNSRIHTASDTVETRNTVNWAEADQIK